MSDFLEGLRRLEESDADDRSAAAARAQHEAEDQQRIAHRVNAAWQDMAKYLSQQGVRTFQYRHFEVNWTLKMMSHYLPESPKGFVLQAVTGSRTGSGSYGRHQTGIPRRASRNLSELRLLLPDGRRWRHKVDTAGVEQGFEDLADECRSLEIDEEGQIYRTSYGDKHLYMEDLAKLAQHARNLPETFPALWS